jgi:nitroimidazol reductase NimA-like FMN-containing flavoprotein (pyridoxamine 5'-phosphate oxidase superfamily)/N-acetylglutamate synthase-like GNAT family acetyltransferase
MDQAGRKLDSTMRRKEFAMSAASALEFLSTAPVVHFASTRPDGSPVLRTVNFVISNDLLLFHGAPSGEKIQCIGREAVLEASETVATIPSYFIDPERACPATTFFTSVQVHAKLERIDDVGIKAEMLSLLMQKYQPEGGYQPLSADSPLYANVIRGVLVLGARLERITGKAKLGQNRKPEEILKVVEGLWKRGAPGDPRAIERVLRANPHVELPRFLRGPAGTTLACALFPSDLENAVSLLQDEYWNVGVPREVIARALLHSAVWVGARDENGALIATARANTDASRHAFIADVAIAAGWRRRGLGQALVRMLLDHPAMRDVRNIRLGTADAQSFYEKFGFGDENNAPPLPFARTPMYLRRSGT